MPPSARPPGGQARPRCAPARARRPRAIPSWRQRPNEPRQGRRVAARPRRGERRAVSSVLPAPQHACRAQPSNQQGSEHGRLVPCGLGPFPLPRRGPRARPLRLWQSRPRAGRPPPGLPRAAPGQPRGPTTRRSARPLAGRGAGSTALGQPAYAYAQRLHCRSAWWPRWSPRGRRRAPRDRLAPRPSPCVRTRRRTRRRAGRFRGRRGSLPSGPLRSAIPAPRDGRPRSSRSCSQAAPRRGEAPR